MFYLPIILVAALAIAAATKRSPRTATIIGIAALTIAVVAVILAEMTGNLLLFYLGALTGLMGLFLVVFGAFGTVHRAGGRLHRDV